MIVETREDLERIYQRVEEDLGPLIHKFLVDPDCEDLIRNHDGSVVTKLNGRWETVGHMSNADAGAIISNVAWLQKLEINHEYPRLETVLPTPDGSRFEGLIPPLVPAPVIAIRTRAKKIYTLEDYVIAGILEGRHSHVLAEAVDDKLTILVSGATGSGKTTFLNGLIAKIRDDGYERPVLIEDTPELQCPIPNHTKLLSSRTITMNDCLKDVMRLIPTRIIVGEVRGQEALAMLKTFNTGHPGFCSIHANDAKLALERVQSLVQEATGSHYDARKLIAESIHLVVHMTGGAAGRKVSEVARVGWCKAANDFELEAA